MEFTRNPLGHNPLNGLMKTMFARVGIEGITNHCAKVAAATRMVQANVAEPVIQQAIGNRSVNGTRKYFRLANHFDMDVSKAIQPSASKAGPPPTEASSSSEPPCDSLPEAPRKKRKITIEGSFPKLTLEFDD